MWVGSKRFSSSKRAGRGILAGLLALLLGSILLAAPFLLCPVGAPGYVHRDVCKYDQSNSDRMALLDSSAPRDLQGQAAVDLGRAASNLSLEKDLKPYKAEPSASRPDNATANIDSAPAVKTDTYSASLALLALSEQSRNGANRTIVDMARSYERGIGQGQSTGQQQGNGLDAVQGDSLLGSWDGYVSFTAMASYALQASMKITGSNLSRSIDMANDWLENSSVVISADEGPAGIALSALALAEDGRNVTRQLGILGGMQASNGSIGGPEASSWAVVALSKGDTIGQLAAAGKAVNWLASRDDMNDSGVALATYAEKTYEKRYMEVRADIGSAIPAPSSMAPSTPKPAENIILSGSGAETPQWLSILGLAVLTLGAVGLFARLRGEDRILSGVRLRILERLRREPGEHQAGIQRAFGLSTGSAVYNLRVLEDKGYITAHRDGRHKRFYANGNSLRPVANGMTKFIVSALRNANTKRMAVYLLDRPGAPQKELSENLHLDPSTVFWHAERLRKVGMLKTIREGRRVAYHLDRPEIIHQILSFIP